MPLPTIFAALATALVPLLQNPPNAIQSPEQYFGFAMGADGKLVNYVRAGEYLDDLQKKSKWIQLEDMGRTTLGLAHWLAVISTPQNLENAADWKNAARKLIEADTTKLEEARAIAKNGKIIVMITCGIHSDEVAAPQMALELAHDIVTNNALPFDRDKIFNNLILLLVPSVNPDGQEMVANWVARTAGTEHEGAPLPWLYNYFAGHDNNRDWFAFNLPETRNISEVLYRKWRPQVLVDHHQMGSRGARFFVPPFGDPLNRAVHPLVWRGANLFGQAIAYELETAGKTGVTHDSYYQGWWQGGLSRAPWWHHGIGILTEAASANLAFPISLDECEVEAGGGLSTLSDPLGRFPSPWRGGAWRVRDICDYQKIATYATLRLAAERAEDILWNNYQMSAAAIAKGRIGDRVGAWVFPAEKTDLAARDRLMEMLRFAGARIIKLNEPWSFDQYHYGRGTFVARLDQPFGPYVHDLLEDQKYPEIPNTQRPYDITGWTLWRMMGVACDRVDFPAEAPPVGAILESRVTGITTIPENIKSQKYVAIDGRSNDAFRAAMRIISEQKWLGRSTVSLKTAGGRVMEPGAFLVNSADMPDGGGWLTEGLSIEVAACADPGAGAIQQYNGVKIGIFEPSEPSIDRGWTQFVIDHYIWKPQIVRSEDVARVLPLLDTFILPESSPEVLWDGGSRSDAKLSRVAMPKEFLGGIGGDGVKALRAFVERGGTLIALGTSCDFLIERMDLPVTNILKGVKREEFSCPGSLLKLEIVPGSSLALGMPSETAAFFASNVAFRTTPSNIKFERHVLARYPVEGELLLSGYLKGEEKLRGAAAAVEIGVGKGKIVLFGARVQHRAQTDATFKLLFNSVLSSVVSK